MIACVATTVHLVPPHYVFSYCYKLLFAEHLTIQDGKTALDKARAKSHGEVESLLLC